MTNKVEPVVVSGSSETYIVGKDGKAKTFTFGPGTPSTDIVTASLDRAKLSGVTPAPVQNLLVYNINVVEKQAQEIPKEKREHEFSFELNLGVVKFGWKTKK